MRCKRDAGRGLRCFRSFYMILRDAYFILHYAGDDFARQAVSMRVINTDVIEMIRGGR